MSVPLNGAYAKYGDMVLKGLNLASEEWNAEHPGQRVTLVVKDTQAEPDAVVKSLENLTKEDGVMAVIGPLGAQSAKAAPQWQTSGVYRFWR